jgi:hypothetical protein
MITERLANAIEILNYAKKNNTTITEACRAYNRNPSYVRDTRLDYKDKNDPDFLRFLELYRSVVNKAASINNPVPQNINEVISELFTEEEKALLSDEVIKKEEIHTEEKPDGTFEVDYRGNKHIKTVADLLETSQVDLNVWKLEKGIVNKYDVTMKLKKTVADEKTGKPVVTHEPATFQNFQVKLFLTRKRTKDQQAAFDEFLGSIRENAPKFNFNKPHPGANLQDGEVLFIAHPKKKYLLELSLPDLHIGKLSWEDESGENYDTKIAIERYNQSVAKLLDHVRHYKNEIEEILLPIGNDLFNIDNKNNMTTAGTPQHVDSRWQQMFQKAKGLLINNINDLMQIAPVRVLMVSGNHDMQTVFYLGSVLEAYYRNTDKVTIDNSPTQRKYHSYGINLIGFTHGNEEKHQELGLIMATEKPQEWAASKCRQFHLGHFHSRKTTKYLDVQEFQGFTVRVLPSLSGTDAWHNSKGYMSMKSAVAYLYSKDNGLVAEFSHNII